MYKRIMEVSENDEKWFQRIQEWNDEEFIVHSIEQRIAKNACNKSLWKIYIEYLRPRNFKAMLGIYCRYCGYFLDDFEMKDEYLKEAKKFGIEANENLLLDFSEFGSIKTSMENSEAKHFIPNLNLYAKLEQYFDFPSPIICYLFKEPKILHKLFETCKYFFLKHPTPICYRLVIAENRYHPNINYRSKLEKQALTIFNVTSKLKEFKNLYVTNYLQIAESKNNNLVTEIFPCIYKFSVKYLTIESHQILLKDFIFMTESKTVEELNFFNVDIFAEKYDGTLAQLEDIMKTLPNVYHFK
uniref:Uncharacterized protein n=1 Tax=Panagrolaimus sp. ES5 TaxID=591445 RepID=A0AC34G0Y6_9BILA